MKAKIRSSFFILSVLAFAALTGTSESTAQPIPDDNAPPPLKKVSKEEASRLEAVIDVKKRTQLALDVMSARLTKAETLIEGEQHDQMYLELGGFHGLMDNTLDFLNKSDRSRAKVLNNYKRFELGLRQFRPRLELIRRNVPVRYELYIRNLILYVREARAKAIEPFFSDTVVPERP